MQILTWIAVAVGCAAITEDLLRARISHWTSGGAVLGGFLCHCARDGWAGFSTALLGTAAGFGIFLVLYLSGGMGGGDIKLMAGFGSLLGPVSIFKAALLTAALGAILAAAVFVIRRGKRIEAIPYAPAITLGAWLVLAGSA